MRGSGYWLRIVWLLMVRSSCMGCSFPSFFLMKKKEEVYGDIEGTIYPFSSCSSIQTSSVASSSQVIGYTLQLMESGAPGLRVIV